ncbi:MAG: DUF3486 family protein [Martelella sp.]|uniref:DUF3486 family protein n=1 Tax=Martelella sp. TaxID=1969699 RepID=UPI003242E5C2
MATHTRPRPSKIDLLPEECEGIVAWAAQELANTGRTQTDIYKEFVSKLEALKVERRGELEFDIPSFNGFNRHNLRLAKLMEKMRRTQQIADAVVERSEGQDADKLTQAASRMLKTLIVEMMENASDDGFTPKEAMNAAAALRNLGMAENVSTLHRQKVEAEFAQKAKKAVETVAKVKGLSDDGAKSILEQILGVAI